MANQVEICNLALRQVKGGRIESITESSTEAETLRDIYEICRDSALTDISPRWARKQAALALLTETVSGFDYVYQYPADCLRADKIYNSASDSEEDRLPFEIGTNAAGTAPVIMTMIEEAELIYVAKITTTAAYDFLFVEALAWKLAMYLAMPLKGDDKLQAQAARAYAGAVGMAKSNTRNEGHVAPEVTSSFVRAR